MRAFPYRGCALVARMSGMCAPRGSTLDSMVSSSHVGPGLCTGGAVLHDHHIMLGISLCLRDRQWGSTRDCEPGVPTHHAAESRPVQRSRISGHLSRTAIMRHPSIAAPHQSVPHGWVRVGLVSSHRRITPSQAHQSCQAHRPPHTARLVASWQTAVLSLHCTVRGCIGTCGARRRSRKLQDASL
jgi:hypothetical protein